MILAKNLRIGNVINGARGLIDTVFEILDNTSRGIHNQFGYEHLILVNGCGNQYKPIEIDGVELNTEWMIKCGFKEDITLKDKNVWAIDVKEKDCEPYAFVVYQKQNEDTFYILYKMSGMEFTKKLKYVHTLQNTFHTFTEQELNVIL